MWSRAVYLLEPSPNQQEQFETTTTMTPINQHHHHHHHRPEKDCREMQTILVMGGITFFIAIVIVLSKFEMSSESVMNYAPIIWLIGVIIFGAVINTIDYYKNKKRRKEMQRIQENLLADMHLPASFPCLLPGPHDECCGGRGIPTRPLPTYDELEIADETIEKREEVSPPPPDYKTALTMLRQNEQATN